MQMKIQRNIVIPRNKSPQIPLTHPLKQRLYDKLQRERERECVRNDKFSTQLGSSFEVYAGINFEDYGISSIEDLIDLSEDNRD